MKQITIKLFMNTHPLMTFIFLRLLLWMVKGMPLSLYKLCSRCEFLIGGGYLNYIPIVFFYADFLQHTFLSSLLLQLSHIC